MATRLSPTSIRMNVMLSYVLSKLPLSVDENVVRGAKRYAVARGTSVSRLVEGYLDLWKPRAAPGSMRSTGV
jgi:uncharacterized protein DUF6364